MRRALAIAAGALAILMAGPATAALATWTRTANLGTAATKAFSMPAGKTPTTTVSGRNVTVSWTASTLSASAVADYVVKRYDSANTEQTVGSGCSGTITATTCTESAVSPGDWRYTVSPKRSNWTGAASPLSATTTVGSPTLTFSSSTTVTTLPTTLSGTVSNFVSGATITFRLDNASTGTVLTGSTSPSPLPSNGSASVSVTIPAGTANGTHTVYAVGSAGGVASATISVAAVTCPTTAPSLTWISGLENGQSTTAGGGMWNVALGTATLDSTVKRNGAYSLRLSPVAAAATRGRIYSIANPAYVLRFALRLASLPVADTELMGMLDLAHANTGPYFQLKYIAASQKLAIGFPGQSIASANPVQAGTWYTIEVRFDPRTNPQTADWRIDNVAQTSASYAQTASTAYDFYFGSSAAATFTANYDDIAVSETSTDYPIGDGKELALVPDGMGTSVGATNFTNDDGTAINSTTWNRLDEIPMGQGTDGVKQVTASTTSYVETTFQDTTETCVRAVGGRVVYDPLNSNQANDGKTVIADGVTERTLYAGSMAANNTAMNPKYATIPPLGAAWTPAELNGLKARIGYSSDASPSPNWQSLLLEYDVPQ